VGTFGLLLVIQAQLSSAGGPQQPAAVEVASVRATRAADPPVLDGSDEDAVWLAAPAIDRFLQARPSEGAPARYATVARVAYDPGNLYVFVRAFDPHPDSIISLLSRRDEQTASDEIIVMIDSWHDRRTGFEFVVNPAGVKSDYAIFNDGNEDVAWDGVWDVATRTDSLGWTAEYRIPLSQLHYSAKGSTSFGFLVWRTVQRHGESLTWPLYRPSRSGFTSQFGEITGLEGLASPGHAEIIPYVLARNEPGPASDDYARDQDVTIGGDVKYRITSNFLLNATVNPDFGQVEADPSVLNLGAFETFFEERRPFFVQAKGLFTFPVNCVVVVDCSTGEGLFYSRRIGRSPQLSEEYGDESSPEATRIIGAAKVTGRLRNGLSIGFLDAVTDDVTSPTGTLEPTTNYAVARGNQEFAGGDGNAGFIATAVNRALDASSGPWLHRSAFSTGLDARRRFAGKRYEVSGSFDWSRVAGTPAAITQTQRNTVHLYQRPDGPLELDSTRTSLAGSNVELRLAKVGGRRLVWETAYQRRTPGFEINDIGFLRQADQQMWTTWANLAFRTPNRVFRELRWNFNNWQHWSIDGLPTERAFNTNVHTQLRNRWWLHAGGTVGQIGATYCDRCARGGPAIRQDPYIAPWAGIEGDASKSLVPRLWVNYWWGDGSRSETLSLEPTLEIKVSSRFSTTIGTRWEDNRNDSQYFDTFTDSTGTERYTFAHLEQSTLSFTWRLAYTFSPNATLQVYASPFVSKGTYSDVREIGSPRAADYDGRYRPYDDPEVAGDPGGFNVQEFRSNVVFRWEYRSGSTLFVVWSQGRQEEREVEGGNSFRGDFSDLFHLRPANTFLAKVSYWFAR
jgi:Domain of unknown function (DUF5916)